MGWENLVQSWLFKIQSSSDLLHYFPGEVITHRTDSEGHWLTAVVKIEGYCYNNDDNQNKSVLDDITKVISELKGRYPTDYILCVRGLEHDS